MCSSTERLTQVLLEEEEGGGGGWLGYLAVWYKRLLATLKVEHPHVRYPVLTKSATISMAKNTGVPTNLETKQGWKGRGVWGIRSCSSHWCMERGVHTHLSATSCPTGLFIKMDVGPAAFGDALAFVCIPLALLLQTCCLSALCAAGPARQQLLCSHIENPATEDDSDI